MLIAAESVFDWRAVMDPQVLVFLVGGTIAIVAIVCGVWSKRATEREQSQLKADMIERGFSAEEIIRVIAAGGPAEEADKDSKPARNAAGGAKPSETETVVTRR